MTELGKEDFGETVAWKQHCMLFAEIGTASRKKWEMAALGRLAGFGLAHV